MIFRIQKKQKPLGEYPEYRPLLDDEPMDNYMSIPQINIWMRSAFKCSLVRANTLIEEARLRGIAI